MAYRPAKAWLTACIVFLLTGFLGTTAQAQEGSREGRWSAWLYNFSTPGRLLRLELDGTTQPTTLALPEGYTDFLLPGAFTADGDRFAVCVRASDGEAALAVYDLPAGDLIFTAALGKVIQCALNEFSFNAGGDQLALGYLFDIYTTTPNPLWKFDVVELSGGDILATFDSRRSPLQPEAIGYLSLPAVRHFEDDRLIFSMFPFAVGGGEEMPTFEWTISTDSMIAQDPLRHGKVSYMALPATGEAIWIEENPAFPPVEPAGMMPAWNVVMLAEDGVARPLLSLSPDVMAAAIFVENGNRVVVQSLQNRPDRDALQSVWVALGREGSLTPLPIEGAGSVIWGTPAGYIFTRYNDAGATVLEHHQFIAGQSEPEISILFARDESGWGVIWTSRLTGDSAAPPFLPFEGVSAQ